MEYIETHCNIPTVMSELKITTVESYISLINDLSKAKNKST
ncbi:Hypothetical protein EIN_074130, partial [Entamoeba invadens IP1]